MIGKLAVKISVHPSLVSQILKGEKSLTLDQAIATGDFFGLSEIENDYLLLLVQRDRAATPALKDHLDRKINELKEKSLSVTNRLSAEKVLSEQAQGLFYSDWSFTAIRQMTAIKNLDTAEAISAKINLPLKEVRRVLDFLEENGLCVLREGKYSVGPKSTHMPENSPWARVHHRSWRQRALEQMQKRDPSDFSFTCPLTIAASDVDRVRERVIHLIDEVYKIVDPSPSEELRCLNIDWFKS